ncbi:hypothetical protein CY34DRAFT_13233 [Suillus luteus UH-Slu-Lm8-n1]|uniref:MYND-type domain-containing protein n=1 Tax=Suillus luteus UH-Slu-Lm8-n1 TaxID=930992 RepID=A0A0D0BCH9_9AGAM|nr:hypothetical protein CY34DRAFT_13233 [Suillus luteus UH-Slu-Lm8-n1]
MSQWESLPTWLQNQVKQIERGSLSSLASLKSLNRSISSKEFSNHLRPYFQTLIPLFFVHLDPRLVPHEITSDSAHSIMLAKVSIMGISCLCGENQGELRGAPQFRQKLSDAIHSHWSGVSAWVQFFYHNFLVPRDDPVARLHRIYSVTSQEAASTSIRFLYVASVLPGVVARLYRTTPGIERIIMELWYLVTNIKHEDCIVDPYLRHWRQDFNMLRAFMAHVVTSCVYYEAPSIPLPPLTSLIEAAGGRTPMVLAALKCLRFAGKGAAQRDCDVIKHDLDLSPLNTLSLTCKQTLIFMFATSQADPVIRELFLTHSSIRTVLNTLAGIGTRPGTEPNLDPANESFCQKTATKRAAMAIGHQYISFVLACSNDPIETACHALRCRLLEVLLRNCVFPSENRLHKSRWLDYDIRIFEQLGGTLIYERVVRIASTSMQYIDSQRLYVHAMHDPTLWGSLLTFKEILSQRWRILSTLTPCTRPEYERTCGGPGCEHQTSTRAAWSTAHRKHCNILKAGIGMAKASRHLRSSLPFIALVEAAEFDDDKWPGQRALQHKLATVQEENPADVHSLVLELDMTVLPIKHRIQPLRQCIGQFQDTNWMRIIQGRQDLQGSSILPVMTIITTIEGARRRSLFSPRTALQLAFKWPPSEFTEELLPIPRKFLSDYCTKAFTGCADEGDASKYDPDSESIRKNPTLAVGAAGCSRASVNRQVLDMAV